MLDDSVVDLSEVFEEDCTGEELVINVSHNLPVYVGIQSHKYAFPFCCNGTHFPLFRHGFDDEHGFVLPVVVDWVPDCV